EDMKRDLADALEATPAAFDAICREGGESELSEIKFTGGEALDEQRTSRLEVRDKKGRRHKLYFDVLGGVLAGFCCRDSSGRWVEVRLSFAKDGRWPDRIVRLDDATGEPLGEDDVKEGRVLVPDDALFEAEGK